MPELVEAENLADNAAGDVATRVKRRSIVTDERHVSFWPWMCAMASALNRVSVERIKLAAAKIDPVFLHTPQFFCEPLGAELGVRLAVKIETLNPIRSFKGRGADWLVSQVAGDAPLLCASAGNFGQAMAYAARKRGLPLTVYASVHANRLKIERVRQLGAKVVLEGEDFDAAKLAAKQFAATSGGRFVEDGLDVETLEGAGTIGLEWLELPPLDALLIPLGNGALFNGVARVIKAQRPATRLIAVQAAGAPAMCESWREKRVVIHEQIHTIADGIGVRVPIPEAVDDLEGYVDEAILVSEPAIMGAMRKIHHHVGVVAEPSAAVGIAALVEQRPRFDGQLVGTIITGGNLTEEQMRAWL